MYAYYIHTYTQTVLVIVGLENKYNTYINETINYPYYSESWEKTPFLL